MDVRLPLGTAEPPSVRPVPRTPAQRHAFVDLLRGFALVVMIETHVVNAYLHDAGRDNAFFFCLTFVNGLVAPSFLFASGFSMRLQAERVWDEWLRLGPAWWRQLRRLGFIGLVADFTHLRGFRLSRYLEGEPGVWREALQVDILQCIVASLLVLHMLMHALRNRYALTWGAAAAASAVAAITPWMWAQPFAQRLPLGVAAFLNPAGISYFPLFPWLAFVLAGSVAAHLFLGAQATGRTVAHVRSAAAAAVAVVPVALVARHLPWSLPGLASFYTTSPLYVLIRLACVILVAAGLFGLEHADRRGPESVRLAGQESLVVYGAHLWLIFAVLRGKHLGPILGLRAGWTVSLLLSGAIVVAMLALARGWRRLKETYPRATRYGLALVVSAMVVVFAVR